jgi:hypothetical protein
MEATMKVISLLVLSVLLFSAGAFGQDLDRDARTSAEWRRVVDHLTIGSNIKVRTADGEQLTAVLMVVANDGVVVAPKTRVPEPPRFIAYGRIAQLDPVVQKTRSFGHAAATGAGVGAAAFLVVLLGLFH